MNAKFSKRTCCCLIIIALLCALVLSDGQVISNSAASTIIGEWKTVISAKDEPGEPLVVSGTVYKPDGKTPVEGITVYVYHTDAEGYYRKGNNSSSNPRLHGTMRTDTFLSVRPLTKDKDGVWRVVKDIRLK